MNGRIDVTGVVRDSSATASGGRKPAELPPQKPGPDNGFQIVKRNLTGLTSRARLPNFLMVGGETGVPPVFFFCPTASGGRKPAELNPQKPATDKRFPDRKKKPHGTHVPRSPAPLSYGGRWDRRPAGLLQTTRQPSFISPRQQPLQ